MNLKFREIIKHGDNGRRYAAMTTYSLAEQLAAATYYTPQTSLEIAISKIFWDYVEPTDVILSEKEIANKWYEWLLATKPKERR